MLVEDTIKSDEKAQEKVWGAFPKRPTHLSVKPISVNRGFLSGRASSKQLIMELDFGDGIEEIPLEAVIPNRASPCPAVVIINEEDNTDNLPTEELVSKGYAVFSFYYGDVTDNSESFSSGLFHKIAGSRRKKTSSGKAVVWAWTAIRVLEYAADLDEIDSERIGVSGSGIFALSALIAAAYDDRFRFVSVRNTPSLSLTDLKAENPQLFCPAFLRDDDTNEDVNSLISSVKSRIISLF